MAATGSRNDDPLKLRQMLSRAHQLGVEHELGSVVVGIAGREGDLLVPEVLDYIESALRMEDAIFRMTRERAVLLLADADRARAEEIVARLLIGFSESFTPSEEPRLVFGYFEVPPDAGELSVKQVLPSVFTG